MTKITKAIEEALEQKLESGMTNKNEIYRKVVDELDVPRPTVRRIARDLRSKYLERIRILQRGCESY